MKKLTVPLLLGLLLLMPLHATAAETLHFGRFGTVTLYRHRPHPAHVVLFLSGDGGWNLGVIDMARALSRLNALVVGISVPHYLKALGHSKERCVYPAADFEALSQFVQKKLGFPSYHAPILVGYSSGATIVYALLVEAPVSTFAGGMSLGFCPDLEFAKPFCRGRELRYTPLPKGPGVDFLQTPQMPEPWVAFQGTIDQVCNPPATHAFVERIGGAKVVMLPHVGHGFSVQRHWMPQFKKAFAELTTPPAPPASAKPQRVKDLPLVEVPATGPQGDTLAVILSGDGGWASIDRQLGNALAERGLPVVGLNSLKYFWTPRTPDGAAHDLARILDVYLARWRKKRILLAGYSFGADVLPFLANRLPAPLREKVRLVALLGADRTASFAFHLSDWLGGTDPGEKPLLPEIGRLTGTPLLCLYGKEDANGLVSVLKPGPGRRLVALPGAHHFDGAYRRLATLIFETMGEIGKG